MTSEQLQTHEELSHYLIKLDYLIDDFLRFDPQLALALRKWSDTIPVIACPVMMLKEAA